MAGIGLMISTLGVFAIPADAYADTGDQTIFYNGVPGTAVSVAWKFKSVGNFGPVKYRVADTACDMR